MDDLLQLDVAIPDMAEVLTEVCESIQYEPFIFQALQFNTLTITAIIHATGVHWQPRNMFENKRATSGKNL